MEAEWFILHKVFFLDRDGLINRKTVEHDYIRTWSEFEFLPGVHEAVKKINDAGYYVIVITNQQGVARNIMTIADVNDIHQKMKIELKKFNAFIDGIYVCPHAEGTCTCRKPDIGLFHMAEQEFEIDKDGSWMIGDSEVDEQAGKKYGIQTIVTTDLLDAVEQILNEAL